MSFDGLIPLQLFQTARDFSRDYSYKHLNSWRKVNPDLRIFRYTDDEMDRYVQAHMSEHVIKAYHMMPLPVLKADYFRYIVILVEGGIYSDSDTECLKPVREWIPFDTTFHPVGFVCGIESRSAVRTPQLCQWTFAAKPRHPFMQIIVDAIASQTLDHSMAKRSCLRREWQVMDWTGPVLWTDLIVDYIHNVTQQSGSKNEAVSNMEKPRLFDDVLMMPVTAFNPEASGGKGWRHPDACARHWYSGGWKKPWDAEEWCKQNNFTVGGKNR